jgi:casein kinase II subunit beta
MNTEPPRWISWFLSQPFASYFIEIDPSFLSNPFNLYGLRQKVVHFRLALTAIRGRYIPVSDYDPMWPKNLNDYAIILYGLLHARYLLTPDGLARMKAKYDLNGFETCPRTFCRGTRCLPFGFNDEVMRSNLKLFCPNCGDVYRVRRPECGYVDGAFFGQSWVHLFIARYPEVVPEEPPEKYVLRLFGYKIAEDAPRG